MLCLRKCCVCVCVCIVYRSSYAVTMTMKIVGKKGESTPAHARMCVCLRDLEELFNHSAGAEGDKHKGST